MTIVRATPTDWVLDVRGPVGAVVAALAGLPVRDLAVDPFKLEDYIAQFYNGGGLR